MFNEVLVMQGTRTSAAIVLTYFYSSSLAGLFFLSVLMCSQMSVCLYDITTLTYNCTVWEIDSESRQASCLDHDNEALN